MNNCNLGDIFTLLTKEVASVPGEETPNTSLIPYVEAILIDFIYTNEL